ncbi:hypothetical protein PASE110613_05140 [Paenibacillus sediminis]|uniref:Group-specific protein n=1 Tax=Paenibacillus sediminis TaxID=664909 RepID=A0ABS4H0V7_9BACL|nr:hypothetical protein [Paenibacillus sediminis]MBP1936159.1 hypothetical protein [Paenibacillus sediminis]
MFDPTIFDNLKVVFEGSIYDLDREGEVLVIDRKDQIDLASFERMFLMRIHRPGGNCRVEVRITSGLADFAGELGGIRIADEAPGVRLQFMFQLPDKQSTHFHTFHERLTTIWSDSVYIKHERTIGLETDESAAQFDEGIYRILLTFRTKIDESHIDDIESLLEHLLESMDSLESDVL